MPLDFQTHEQCEHLGSTIVETALSGGIDLKPRIYAAGVAIWGIGALPDRVYRLRTGRVNIVSVDLAGNELLLRTVRPGEIFGEVCFCGHRTEPHGLIASSAVQCEILEITYE